MGQPKGQSGNPSGKPKGAKNRTTKQMKELLTKFAEDKIEDVIDAFDELDAKDKVSAFTSLLKYVIPPARDTDADKAGADAVSMMIDRLFNRGGKSK